jgi:hypothetical protein
MPYVQRSDQGQIIALFARSNDNATEWLGSDSWELTQFLDVANIHNGREEEVIEHLSASDIRMVRVLEDLLEVLITNKVILFTDLPTAAQEKLLERRSARSLLNTNDDELMASDNDPILI